jgi:CRISPR-associated protein Cas2
MIHILLVYDIASDRVRAKVADACLDYGLDRIQYSAFAGTLSSNHQRELMRRIRALLDDSPNKIVLIPICDADWKKRQEIEHVG